MRNPFAEMAIAAATMAARARRTWREVYESDDRIPPKPVLPRSGFRAAGHRSFGEAQPAGHKLIRAHKRSGSVYGRKVWL